MKRIIIFAAAVVFAIGCARVSFQAPKEPIKLDISMRLDVYQHVQKDINSIEDIVSGSEKTTKTPDKYSFLYYFSVATAYAQDALDPAVEKAALSRKARLGQVVSLLQAGIVGENKLGLLDARSAADSDVKQFISSENSDRMVIYQALAAKNNASVEEIQKIYALRLQNDAPGGAPVEALNSSTGTYQWQTK